MPTPSEYRFDGWTLCRATGELVRADRRTRLPEQPLRVLEALLARPGELVTREALIERLWPKGVVEFDTALNSAVRRLRRALDDEAERPRYIETLPRRGYRFVGRLEPEPPASRAGPGHPVAVAAARGNRRRLSAALLLIALALAAPPAAVDAGRHARPPDGDTAAQAREHYLRARHFLARRQPGDLALAGRYFRATLTIDPTRARAWSGLASVYWLETRAGGLEPETGMALMADAADRALALAPELAEAHVRRGNLLSTAGDRRGAEAEWRLALALDPQDGLALSIAASVAAGEGRLDQAIALQRRSIEADPLSVVSRYNLLCWLMMTHRLAEAREAMRQIAELSPALAGLPVEHARLLVLEGRFEQALEAARQVPDPVDRRYIETMAWHGLGRRQASTEALTALVAAAADEAPLRIAEALAWRGEIDEAFGWLQAAAGRVLHDPWAQYSPFLRPLEGDPRWRAWRTADRERPPAKPGSHIG